VKWQGKNYKQPSLGTAGSRLSSRHWSLVIGNSQTAVIAQSLVISH